LSEDYLDRDGLLALGLAQTTVDRLLRDSPMTGHDGRPVVEADRLSDLLDQRGGSHDDRGP
jgi:hypothetical protein